MPPRAVDLQTPWVREHLVEWLTRLADPVWQRENWTPNCPRGSALDDALDFFDDSGVLSEPMGRLGFVLVDDVEVSVMEELNSALDAAISVSASKGEEITRSSEWFDVVTVARKALIVLREFCG